MPKSSTLQVPRFLTIYLSWELVVKKTYLYSERNEKKRTEFKQEIQPLNPANLVYVDECGLDESIRRDYARSPIGQKIQDEKPGKRAERASIIAGLNQDEILAPWHFTGYCNTEVVLTWVKEVFTPSLKKGMTVIWDNATFHKSAQIRECIEKAGCQLIFLPPYSPDLNPIEQYWAKLKAQIRRVKNNDMSIPDVLAKLFMQAH